MIGDYTLTKPNAKICSYYFPEVTQKSVVVLLALVFSAKTTEEDQTTVEKSKQEAKTKIYNLESMASVVTGANALQISALAAAENNTRATWCILPFPSTHIYISEQTLHPGFIHTHSYSQSYSQKYLPVIPRSWARVS